MSISYPDVIRPGANSSGWLRIQMTLCHPDDLGKLRLSSGWQSTLAITHLVEMRPRVNSSVWHRLWNTLRNPDDIGQHRKSSRWHPALVISHPNEIRPGALPSGWHRVKCNIVSRPDDMPHGLLVIQMRYCLELSRPDDIGFKSHYVIRMT